MRLTIPCDALPLMSVARDRNVVAHELLPTKSPMLAASCNPRTTLPLEYRCSLTTSSQTFHDHTRCVPASKLRLRKSLVPVSLLARAAVYSRFQLFDRNAPSPVVR